jgi:lipopolysaccharide exporter
MNAIRHPIAAFAASPLVRGLLAFGSAEAATRVVRLGALMIIARRVTPEVLGTAALALSLFELIRVLANAGIGQRLIVAEEHELAGLCRTAHRLFWAICTGVALIQLAVAAILWLGFGSPQAAELLAALSFVYFFMPAGLVQVFLTMRANRVASIARINAAQSIADILMTVVLVIAWPSPWALVLPKLLAAPVWTVLARRSTPWQPNLSATPADMRTFTLFGASILATEILGAARLNADKLILGALLGPGALGIYYFAFNAGLGITQSFVAACNLVIFPQLAKSSDGDKSRDYRRAFATGLAMLMPVVAAQALLSPFYVPIVFGATWIPATGYIAMLSCAALPLYAGSLVGARYRVAGRPQTETMVTAVATLASLSALAAGAQFGLGWACLGYGAGLAIVFLPCAAVSLVVRTGALNPQNLGSHA